MLVVSTSNCLHFVYIIVCVVSIGINLYQYLDFLSIFIELLYIFSTFTCTTWAWAALCSVWPALAFTVAKGKGPFRFLQNTSSMGNISTISPTFVPTINPCIINIFLKSLSMYLFHVVPPCRQDLGLFHCGCKRLAEVLFDVFLTDEKYLDRGTLHCQLRHVKSEKKKKIKFA